MIWWSASHLCLNPPLPLFLGRLYVLCLLFLLAAVGLPGECQVRRFQGFLGVALVERDIAVQLGNGRPPLFLAQLCVATSASRSTFLLMALTGASYSSAGNCPGGMRYGIRKRKECAATIALAQAQSQSLVAGDG